MESTNTTNLKNILLNNIEQYKSAIIIGFVLFLIVNVSFYMSEQYRISKVVKEMNLYRDYLSLDSLRTNLDLKLSDFYIASSFRPLNGKNQKYDYCSTRILEKVLKYGARFLWLDIYNSEFGDNAKPIISVGKKKGNWKFSLNSVTLEEALITIANTAFTSGKVDNFEDPLILGLNLNVNKNFKTLRKIKDLLVKYLGNKLLGINYSYGTKNMGEVPIRELMNKVVIFSSGGTRGSDLEELINYSWSKPNIKKIIYKSVDPNIKISEYVKEDVDTLKNFNKNNLSIVLPEENTFFTRQFNPNYSWKLGCQFVCMNYQNIDQFMDFYITKFRTNSFVPKPVKLRGSSKSYKRSININKTLSNIEKKDKILANCPLEPKPELPILDVSEQPEFKNDDDNLGVCFISDKCNGPFSKVDNNIPWIINEKDKDRLPFEYSKENPSAGIDTSGHTWYNFNPKVCCSKKKNMPIKNKYILAPACNNPLNTKGDIGLKVEMNDVNKVPFDEGNSDGKYKWMHAKLCNVNSVNDLKDQPFCLISSNKCPKNWSDEIKLENNWNLCCKNT